MPELQAMSCMKEEVSPQMTAGSASGGFYGAREPEAKAFSETRRTAPSAVTITFASPHTRFNTV